jgi:hypothetical protein
MLMIPKDATSSSRLFGWGEDVKSSTGAEASAINGVVVMRGSGFEGGGPSGGGGGGGREGDSEEDSVAPYWCRCELYGEMLSPFVIEDCFFSFGDMIKGFSS